MADVHIMGLHKSTLATKIGFLYTSRRMPWDENKIEEMNKHIGEDRNIHDIEKVIKDYTKGGKLDRRFFAHSHRVMMSLMIFLWEAKNIMHITHLDLHKFWHEDLQEAKKIVGKNPQVKSEKDVYEILGQMIREAKKDEKEMDDKEKELHDFFMHAYRMLLSIEEKAKGNADTNFFQAWLDFNRTHGVFLDRWRMKREVKDFVHELEDSEKLFANISEVRTEYETKIQGRIREIFQKHKGDIKELCSQLNALLHELKLQGKEAFKKFHSAVWYAGKLFKDWAWLTHDVLSLILGKDKMIKAMGIEHGMPMLSVEQIDKSIAGDLKRVYEKLETERIALQQADRAA